MKEKYIIWNDGMGITAMGVLSNVNADGSYDVIDPCTVVFAIGNEELPGQDDVPQELRKVRGVLRFDIQPYFFNALIANGAKQTWTVRPHSVLKSDVEINDELINAYRRTVVVTSSTK